jgi:hypothetical protein
MPSILDERLHQALDLTGGLVVVRRARLMAHVEQLVQLLRHVGQERRAAIRNQLYGHAVARDQIDERLGRRCRIGTRLSASLGLHYCLLDAILFTTN